MTKPLRVAIDQYGAHFYFRTIKELREQVPGRCTKMYIDRKNGAIVCIGRVIGHHWLRFFTADEETV